MLRGAGGTTPVCAGLLVPPQACHAEKARRRRHMKTPRLARKPGKPKLAEGPRTPKWPEKSVVAGDAAATRGCVSWNRIVSGSTPTCSLRSRRGRTAMDYTKAHGLGVTQSCVKGLWACSMRSRPAEHRCREDLRESHEAAVRQGVCGQDLRMGCRN